MLWHLRWGSNHRSLDNKASALAMCPADAVFRITYIQWLWLGLFATRNQGYIREKRIDLTIISNSWTPTNPTGPSSSCGPTSPKFHEKCPLQDLCKMTLVRIVCDTQSRIYQREKKRAKDWWLKFYFYCYYPSYSYKHKVISPPRCALFFNLLEFIRFTLKLLKDWVSNT